MNVCLLLMSQSLINQGYIPIKGGVKNGILYNVVAIPYKSGIYSNEFIELALKTLESCRNPL